MRQLLFCIAGIFFTMSSFGQFADTAELSTYIRDTIRDRRPERVTAAQLQKALLGTTKFLNPPGATNRIPYYTSASAIGNESGFEYNPGTNTLQANRIYLTTTASHPALALGAGIPGDPTITNNFELWSSTATNTIRTKLNNTIYNIPYVGATASNRVAYYTGSVGGLTSSTEFEFTQSSSTYTLSVGSGTDLNSGIIRLGTTTGAATVEAPGTFGISIAGVTGSSGQVLTANGSGRASWQNPVGTGDMLLASAQTSTGKKTFQADATNAGLRLGPVTTAPSTLVTGDLWYRSTNNSYHGWVGADVLFPYTTPTTHQPNAIMVFQGSGAANEGLFGCNANFTYTLGDGLGVDKITSPSGLTITVDPETDYITQATASDGTGLVDNFYVEDAFGSKNLDINGGTGAINDAVGYVFRLNGNDQPSFGLYATKNSSVSKFEFNTANSFIFTDPINSKGAQYAADYSAANAANPRWIPDKAYVDAAAGGGGGDVDGPASATDNAIARFDGTTGKIIQNSGVTISDLGTISAGTLDLNGTSAFSIKTASSSRVSIDNSGTISLHNAPSNNNSSTKVLTRNTGTQAVETMDVSSGNFTPTVGSVTGNLTSTTAFPWQYIRVGNVVTMSGLIGCTTNATGLTTIEFTLPVSSSFTAQTDLAGAALCGSNGVGISLKAETSNNTGRLTWNASASGADSVWIQCTYTIK